jgi:hypothetical protein
VSRQEYLKKREEAKLEELKEALEDEKYLFQVGAGAGSRKEAAGKLPGGNYVRPPWYGTVWPVVVCVCQRLHQRSIWRPLPALLPACLPALPMVQTCDSILLFQLEDCQFILD